MENFEPHKGPGSSYVRYPVKHLGLLRFGYHPFLLSDPEDLTPRLYIAHTPWGGVSGSTDVEFFDNLAQVLRKRYKSGGVS